MEERHGLTLHVRAHEGPVCIVMLQEGDQGSRHRHQLVRRHVHVVDVLGTEEGEVTSLPTEDELVLEVPLVVQGRIGLGDPDLFLLVGREPLQICW